MHEQDELKYNEPWILQRADPYIIRHIDGYYYFTATVPAYDRIIIRQSKTLAGLKDAVEHTIWIKHDEGEMGSHIWAPELHYLDNKWYIYFAAGDAEDIWKIRPYILECSDSDPINGTWIEKGKIQSCDQDIYSFEGFSLDSTIFEHKGEKYLVWAEKVGVKCGISNLYIAKMESPYKLKTPQVLITTPDYDWERVGFWVNEGPFVIMRGNKIFLTFSASSTGACYCVGMLEADIDLDLLNPKSWKKYQDPVVKTDMSRNIYGPGHNCFTVDEEGNDIMVYHARTTEKINGDPLRDPNRHTMLMKINWDEQNNPVFKF
jgi:GH43 family beta-xylosidase